MAATGELKGRRPFVGGGSRDNGAAIPDPFVAAGSRVSTIARKRGTDMPDDDLIADARR
jgi:hypothetical protein